MIKLIFLVLLGVGISSGARAVTCSLDSNSVFKAAYSATMPLNYKNISISNDMPNGTIIYQQRYGPGFGSVTVNCDTTGTWFYFTEMTTTPLSLSSWTGTIVPEVGDGSSSWNGKIYETGLPGVGVVLSMMTSSRTAVPGNIGTSCSGSAISCQNMGYGASVFLTLIKTGQVSPGVINGANFPTMKVALGKTGSAVDLFTLSFSGSLSVTLPTCTTPDYSVSLGHWTLHHFTGKGSATPWVAADIHLTNCGVFHGSAVSSWENVWSESGGSSPGLFQNNVWKMALSPVIVDIVDAENGIIGLEDFTSSAATGIGIQLSFAGTDTADANIVNFNNLYTGTFPATGDSTIKIPLSARYIQTKDTVSVGSANGRVMYTIIYN